MLDLLIKNGFVVDGSGNPRFRADIGIKNEIISLLEQEIEEKADRVIDAKGLIVCPGFIDTHSHGDRGIVTCRTADNKIMQGITTEINGNCGSSAAPIIGEESRRLYLSRGGLVEWETYDEYINYLNEHGISINVVSLVGHNNLRHAVAGHISRRVYKNELEEMKLLLEQCMREGAFGLSTGLVYGTGAYSDTYELIELCKIVSKYGGIYTSHQRGEKDQNVEAEWETYMIGEYAKVRVHSSHQSLKIGMFGRMQEFIDLRREANKRGVTWTCDVDPGEIYWCDTGKGLFKFDNAAEQPSYDEKISLLKDPKRRKWLKKRIFNDWPPGQGRFGPFKNEDYDHMRVVQTKDPVYMDKTIEEVARLRGDLDPFDTLSDLYIEQGEDFVFHTQPSDDSDIKYILKNSPFVSVETDSGILPARSDKPQVGNPRPFSTFPRLFQKFVRGEQDYRMEWMGSSKPEKDFFTVEELVMKMTHIAAMQFMLFERGLIRQGMCADITIFNENTIGTKASVYDTDIYPEGIPYVIVNGQVVKDEGKHTGALAGKGLRWTIPSPSDLIKSKQFWFGHAART